MKKTFRDFTKKNISHRDCLTWITRFLVRTLTEKASFFLHGKVRDQAFWSAVIMRQQEQECPAHYFRKVAMTLRKEGNIVAAEEICSRGLAIHPKDLSLATEHAEIARIAKDLPARACRYQLAIDLAGKASSNTNWSRLAESHRLLGNFEKAESVILDGLKIHPSDFSLMEKLTEVFASCGDSLKAITALKSIIQTHPKVSQISSYLRLSKVLSDEGLINRAIDALNEGLTKYPDSLDLTTKLAELHYLQEPSTKHNRATSPPPPPSDYIAHLFRDDAVPFAQGTLCLAIGKDISKQHVPAMLDFAHTIEPPAVTRRLPEVDVFAVWGALDSRSAALRKLAVLDNKPLLYLDDGLLKIPKNGNEDKPALSIIISIHDIYDDAFCPALLETTLNAENYTFTVQQIHRAEACIARLILHRISYANGIDLCAIPITLPSTKASRVLLIDQTTDDSSIHRGLGSRDSFARMLASALALAEHEILIYLSPRADSNQRRSELKSILPFPLPQNVTILDWGTNPHDLFKVVDQVYVVTSPLGFEAVMAGSEVHCFAAPFYAGWGFTTDHTVVPIRKIQRTATEIFYYFYMILSRYYVPGHGSVDLETFIESCSKRESGPSTLNHGQNQMVRKFEEPLRILVVIPSKRHGATGRYFQNLSGALVRLGCEVVILAEGSYQRVEDGVRWLALKFDGVRLTPILQQEIVKFTPHFVYENGVRSRAQRAAVEAVLLTGARFAMQSEDDDTQVYRHHCGDISADLLCALDQPELTTTEIAKSLQELDWNHSLQVFLDPQFDRWVEPVLRGLCYRMACFHTAIWYPFAERLAREYAVPTLVVPPVARASDFKRLPMIPPERAMVLQRYKIDPSATVIFIGGALYSYSNEFALFLDALQLATSEPNANFALVVTSDRSSLPLAQMAAERLGPLVSFIDIGVASDIGYMEMLKACDVVCSPGIPDDFNRYRLPSRLVKAMAMGKPILTCRCGFGESLENNHNAFLTEGNQPADWVAPIAACLDPIERAKVGQNGRIFAEQHFDSDRVAAALKMQFEAMMERPAHQLSDRISLNSAVATPGQTSRAPSVSKVLPSDRYRSTMQDAILPLKQRGIELGTVVHIGAGKCGELEDYCRLGAKQIILVEPLPDLVASLRKCQDRPGKIVIHQMAVSDTTGSHQAYICKNTRPDSTDHEELYLSKPTALLNQQPALQVLRTEAVETCTVQEICQKIQFNGSNDLLVLELNRLELAALKATSEIWIRNFEWIMIRITELPILEYGVIPQSVKTVLQGLGFEYIPSTEDYSSSQLVALFRKRPNLEN
jgi:capsular polysaccharide export protein